MAKIQVSTVVNFSTDAAALASVIREGNRRAMDKAQAIATSHQADFINNPKARRDLSGALADAFIKAKAYATEGAAKATASQWAAVIERIAFGDTFENVASLREAYAAISGGKGKRRGQSEASLKGAATHQREHLAKLSVPERHAYAERITAALAEGLRDGTQGNTALAAALEYAMMHPQAVLELAKADKSFTASVAHRKAA